MKNRFGRRYISDKEFLDYARDVDLFKEHPPRHLLEFLERRGILNPVARIRFPAEIARRWYQERYPTDTVPDPIEGDTPRLQAASDLYNLIFNNLWRKPEIYGERVHPLDEIAPEHAPFIETTFDTATFLPWNDFRVELALRDGSKMYDGGTYSRTCYHFWQIFPLASFLRSGVNILYDLGDEALFRELWELRISEGSRGSLYATMNFEARHELNAIIEHSALFEAVAWFEAYRQNALQKHVHSIDRATGRLPTNLSREYRARERALAREVLNRFNLKPGGLLTFIKFQAELWCEASRRSPAKVADEYRQNIASTVELYRLVARKSADQIVAEVGRAGDYFKPILKIIFPDWLDEQRDLAERSLKSWMLPSMTGLPSPFTISEHDIAVFCNWLEQKELYQLYWHFKRLLDLGFSDASIARSAVATEAVSYANTIELLANAILEERGQIPRGSTLMPKVRRIISSASPDLEQLLLRFKHLTRTDNSTLGRRLAQIDRIRKGGPLSPVLRKMLKLLVIRNEGSHLGLGGLDREHIYALLEALVQASLLIWKAK